MAVSTDISPSTGNLVLATGKLSWKGPGDADHVHMGEALAAEFTLAVTEKPHISKLGPTRVNDFSASELMSATFAATLQEVTSRNLILALLGRKTDGPPIRIDIGANSEITGELRYVMTNNVGPRSQYDFPICKVTPNAALNLLSDDWGNIILTFKVNWDSTAGEDGLGAFGTCLHNITDEVG